MIIAVVTLLLLGLLIGFGLGWAAIRFRVRALADLLGREPKPLNPENGEEKPATVAVIDEQACIGCTLCIQACPVDAIVGAAKLMHTVIESECTGCDLCLPPCPVDCIEMVTPEADSMTWVWPEPRQATAGGVQ